MPRQESMTAQMLIEAGQRLREGQDATSAFIDRNFYEHSLNLAQSFTQTRSRHNPDPQLVRWVGDAMSNWDETTATPPPPAAPTVPSFANWREREEWMFSQGIYKKVPWADEPWAARDSTEWHYVHIAEKDPTMVAFIRAPEKADSRAPHVTLKPGRYLQKYFDDLLDSTAIQHWASQVRGDGISLRFTDNALEVRGIYSRSGLNACMSHSPSHFTGSIYSTGTKHPTEVYLLGGLKLAYTVDSAGNITSRCLVWPEKMLHTRAYGDTQAITKALANAGYKSGLFDGLRLPAIPLSEDRGGDYRDCFLMPFVDNIKWAKKDDQKWSIAGVDVCESLILSERATNATHYVQTTEAVAYPINSTHGKICWDTSRSVRDEYAHRIRAEGGAVPETAVNCGGGGVVTVPYECPEWDGESRVDFGSGPERVQWAEETSCDACAGVIFVGEDEDDNHFTYFGDEGFTLSRGFYRLQDGDCVRIEPVAVNPQPQVVEGETSPRAGGRRRFTLGDPDAGMVMRSREGFVFDDTLMFPVIEGYEYRRGLDDCMVVFDGGSRTFVYEGNEYSGEYGTLFRIRANGSVETYR